ncbi:SF1B family DNA helicase RecD2 [Mycoplasma procyoni]|uniref:SF1B family DNA helicase RecD2 n=1 Tax=Mycoplasma procyoni TaxID=568784 RepID=UPI00197C7DD7|nr:AAA family ATPase [Mycoplasma procyoni]MBN3534798.1 AAA family ATPase [Mycoplasma procyoni]
MKIVTGKLFRILYSSFDKTFFVYLFRSEQDGNEPIKIVAKDELFSDVYYELEIKTKNHPKYGESYELIKWKSIIEKNQKGVINYFSSSIFQGIGRVIANKIYDKWGDNAAEILSKNPKLIFEIQSEITHKKAEIICAALQKKDIETEIKSLFALHNLSNSLLKKLKVVFNLEKYWEILKENPYDVLMSGNKFNFNEIDALALALGFSVDNPIRIQYLILDNIYNILDSQGDTKYNNPFLGFSKTNERFYIEKEYFITLFKELSAQKKLFVDKEEKTVTHWFLKEQEEFIVKNLIEIRNKKTSFSDVIDYPVLPSYLDSIQKDAINSCFENNLIVVTGGPGTGKTEILKHIYKGFLSSYKESDMIVLAPTGRAAYRIFEKSQIKAQTIHSFLEVRSVEGDNFFFDSLNKQEKKVLIIDEFSMVNTDLFCALLKGLDLDKLQKIVLIGDNNQIPSIGYGNLLSDFINSNVFVVSELKNNYRQKDGKSIIDDANMVNKNEVPDLNTEFSLFIDTNPFKINDQIQTLLEQALKKYPISEITILAPIYGTHVGIDAINLFVQQLLFTKRNAESFEINGKTFYIGDKVIQNENDYKLDVLNGEIGFIEHVIKFESKIDFITVRFNEQKLIKYKPSEFAKYISLAYCVSIHKYQGSESNFVIVLIFENYKNMLTKKLIYTAMTRAKYYLRVIGEREAFNSSVKINDRERQTNILKYFKIFL